MSWNLSTKLTQELLAQGYTKDNHPDYVHWHYDGFEYNHRFYQQAQWQTPCGWFIKNLGYCGYGSVNGVEYRPENDNHLVHCLRPDKAPICPHVVPERYRDTMFYRCPVYLTDKPYDYQRSRERIQDDARKLSGLSLRRLEERYPGIRCCDCRHEDEATHTWYVRYNPRRCINYSQHGCSNKVCVITGRPRNLKLGNLYYDVRTYAYQQKGMLRWVDVSVVKGKRWFDHQKHIEDIEGWLKISRGEIQQKEDGKHRTDRALFHKVIFSVVENVRIESRPSRDLHQDLADIAEGITVTHDSDLKKAAAAQKKKRRADRQQKKSAQMAKKTIARLEKLILQHGYEGISAVDQYSANKHLGQVRVHQLDSMHNGQPQEPPDQISLFETE